MALYILKSRLRQPRFLSDDEVVRDVRIGGAAATEKLINNDYESIDKPLMHNVYNLLHIAAHEDNEDAVNWLLSKGANINASSGGLGETPLRLAVERGNEKVAALLIAKGADCSRTGSEDKLPLLHLAAAQGHASIVKLLLDCGFTINDADPIGGRTPLHYTCESGHELLTSWMIFELGADVTVRDNNGCNLLHSCATGGSERIMRSLLATSDAGGVNINAETEDGRTALSLACQGGHEGIVSLLLEQQRDDVTTGNIVGETAGRLSLLHYAAAGGSAAIFNKILERHNRARARSDNNGGGAWTRNHLLNTVCEILTKLYGEAATREKFDGETLLHCAAQGGNPTILGLLLDGGMRVDSTCPMSETPLHRACRTGHSEAVAVLLDRGAQINKPDTIGRSPLNFAVSHSHVDVVKLLLDRGAEQDSATLRTALFSHNASLEIARALIDRGFPISEYIDERGCTLLHLAVECHSSEDVVALLLGENSSGASVDPLVRKNRGETAIHCAARVGHLTTARRIIRANADVISSKDLHGRTALHLAAMHGHTDLIEALVQHGAQLEDVDRDNSTPLLLARGMKTARVLVKLGADVCARDNDGDGLLEVFNNTWHELNVKELREILLWGLDATRGNLLAQFVGRPGRYEVYVDSRARLQTLSGTDRHLIELLLDYGADVAGDDASQLLLQVVRQDDQTAVELLLECGKADVNAIAQGRTSDIVRESIDARTITCAKILVQHTVALETVGASVSGAILETIEEAEVLREFRAECASELAAIGAIEGMGPAIRAIPAAGLGRSTTLASNEDIREMIASDGFAVDYPIYSAGIRDKMRRGKWRNALLGRVNRFFVALSKSEGNEHLPQLPFVCTSKIFSKLSNNDLRRLGQVCDPDSRIKVIGDVCSGEQK